MVIFLPGIVGATVDPRAGEATGYGLVGLLFAGGVLFPYVGRGTLRYVRYLGLFLASVVGYWCAQWLAFQSPLANGNALPFGNGRWPTLLSVTVGSITGTVIVMLALVLLAPIRASLAYVLLGVLAAVGGVLSFGLVFNRSLGPAVGLAVWHTLACLAIYFGTPSTSAGATFSTALVGLFKRSA